MVVNDIILQVPKGDAMAKRNFIKELDSAVEKITAVEGEFKVLLEASFPLGSGVTVKHARGSYTGVIVGYEADVRRLIIKNHMTLKESRRWYIDVRLGC